MITITLIRPQSVDSLNGRFFTRVFSAVGRSGKKKEPLVINIYLSVGLIGAKI